MKASRKLIRVSKWINVNKSLTQGIFETQFKYGPLTWVFFSGVKTSSQRAEFVF